jgi:hypothetical protein
VVCTPYHKGRLRVIYDPYVLVNLTKFNVNYTKIVDLSETNQFEMLVSWADNKLVAYVNTPVFASATNPWSTASIYTPSQTYDNGCITVAVMNQLTAPQDTINNDVGVNVFVSAGDDFELYDPNYNMFDGTVMIPQAGFEDLESRMEKLTVGHPTNGAELAKVVMGERIVSFRQLLKRYVHYYSQRVSAGASNDQRLSALFRDFPLTPGSDSAGLNTSTGLAKAVNFVSLSLITYLATMFAGYRGSFRYKHFIRNSANGTLAQNIGTATRINRLSTSGNASAAVITTGSTDTVALQSKLAYANSFAGMALTAISVKQALEVELPYVSPNRFEIMRPYDTNSVSGLCHSVQIGIPQNALIILDSFISVGEDFNMGYFVGANLWYQNYLVA